MMISQRQSKPNLRPDPSAGPGLSALAAAVRAVVAELPDWRDTAQLAASALERHLPSPSVLTAEQRTEDPATYKSEVLHEEPDGSFSIVALVLLPGTGDANPRSRDVVRVRGHPWHGARGATTFQCNSRQRPRESNARTRRRRSRASAIPRQPALHPGAALRRPAIADMTSTDGTLKQPTHGDREGGSPK